VPYALDLVCALIVVLDAVRLEDLRLLKASGKPIVTVCSFHPELDIPAVFPDNRAGAAAMVHHLLQHGHHDVGFVGCLLYDDTRDRYAAYRTALLASGIEPDPRLLFEAVDMNEPGGIAAAEAILAAGMPCSAVFASTDQNALGLMATIQRAGYRVPEDLAVVGFDDVALNALASPSLTTVRQRNDAIGAEAARLLLALLAGERVPAHRHYVATTPVYRQSCGCRSIQDASSDTSPATHTGSGLTLRRALLQVACGDARDAPAGLVSTAAAGIDRWVEAVEAVSRGEPVPPLGELVAACRDVCTGATSIESVSRAVGVLQKAAGQQTSAYHADAVVADRLRTLFDELRTEVLYAARLPFVETTVEALNSAHQNYRASKALLELQGIRARDLGWLRETGVPTACLGLRTGDQADARLTLAGLYQQRPGVLTPHAGPCRQEEFPPLDLFAPLPGDDPDQMIVVVPLQTAVRDWGALALLCSLERRMTSGSLSLQHWAVLLMAALERERLQALDAAAQAAAERLHVRSDLLSAVSHELRTPLTSVLGYAELALGHWDELTDDDRRTYLRRIADAANRQRRLVDDFLRVSKLSADTREAPREPVPIAALLGQAADDLRLAYKGQRVLLCGPDTLQVLAEPARLRQILDNLLDNAAKYSPEGSPIDVTWNREGSRVAVRVCDHGLGVPLAGRHDLFTRFGRVPGSKARAGRVGTGLGLFLGRQLAETMGAELDLEATGPAGSTFRLRLEAYHDGSQQPWDQSISGCT
jgi:signal transduction histidine kinase